MEKKDKTFKVVTLGCRTNQYESQAYHNQLEILGYQTSSTGQIADICIVNTCTVTASADSHSRQEIRKLARENPGSQLIVTGCFAEREPEKIKQIEGVTHVIANKDKENLLASIFPEKDLPEFSIRQFEAHTRAFVKIQDGCNSYCTYCIIPYVRGRSRSRSFIEIIAEVKTLIENGYKEIVLTGINIGDFEDLERKKEEGNRLADLVRIIDQMPGLKRLRLSSIDPDEVDDDLLQAIIEGKNTCPSMHIVLQSGSNVILKRMNRKYTRQIFIESVERLKKAHADFTFTTDIIVGFPGETERDFAETLEVMKEVEFAKVHMFPYSDRPRTKAATYPNKIAPSIMQERKQHLLKAAEQISYQMRNRFVGQKMTVLIEQTSNQETTGHTANFLSVIIPKSTHAQNELVEVQLLANSPTGLIGYPVVK